MQGTLSRGYSLADAVKAVYVGRRSGILEVENGDARRRLYFQRGSLTFSDSNDPNWRLGTLLVTRGMISQADLDHVLTLLAPAKRIGAVLRDLGYLDERKLGEAVEYQITESIYPLFLWTDGSYRFHELDDPAPSDIAFPISTANVIMEGVRRIVDAELVAERVGELDQVVSLGANPLLRFQSVALKPKEGFVLSRIDGHLTIEEICAISPVPPEEVLKCLYGLKSAGILEIHGRDDVENQDEASGDIAGFFLDFGGAEEYLGGTAKSSPTPSAPTAAFSKEEQQEFEDIRKFADSMGSLDHFAVLGIARDADEKTIRKAYYRLAKRFHPDRHHKSHLADLQERLEAIFVRVNEAYETLNDQDRRATYARGGSGGSGSKKDEESRRAAEDPVLQADRKRQAGEAAFRDGRHFYEQGDVFAAIRTFRHAVNQSPENPGYRSYLGRALAQNPKWRKEAEEHLLKAIELEPTQSEHYAQLGNLYQSANLPSKAKKYFAEALRWDPNNETARRGRARDDRPEAGGLGGTFRSLFGDKKPQ